MDCCSLAARPHPAKHVANRGLLHRNSRGSGVWAARGFHQGASCSYCGAQQCHPPASRKPLSRQVGGVPEILPRHMLHFAEPNGQRRRPGSSPPNSLLYRFPILTLPNRPSGDALLKCLSGAISGVRHDKNARPATSTFHRNVSAMYSWRHVARRTARVYSDAVAWSTRTSLSERLHQLCALGAFAGPAAILVTVVQHLFLSLLRLRRPACDVERAPESSVAANVQWFRKEPVPRTEVLAKLCTRNSCKPLLVVGGIH